MTIYQNDKKMAFLSTYYIFSGRSNQPESVFRKRRKTSFPVEKVKIFDTFEARGQERNSTITILTVANTRLAKTGRVVHFDNDNKLQKR